MEGILFVLNPIAGGGRAKELEALIDKEMEDNHIDYEIAVTTEPYEATEIVRLSKYDMIVAVGGDGTVNEVAKGIIKRGHGTMGIIPGGTGNDLSRSLDIPLDPKEALECLLKCSAKKLDVCTANGYYFFNISSIGFDAEVVNRAAKIKHVIKGQVAYLLSVLYTLIVYRNKKALITVDGVEYNTNMLLLAVGNGKYYGGGFYIMPNSKVDDNKLHACIISDASKPVLLALFPTIFKGTHLKYTKYVHTVAAKHITIETEDNLFFNLDGEILDAGKRIDFKVDDYKIPIVCPS